MSSNTQAYDKLTFPNKPNYETCTDFLFSKLVTTQLPMPFECGDNVERDIQTSYIRAQRELYKHNKTLQDKRHTASEKRISLDKQWVDLQLKEKTFKRTFKHFNKFVQENNEKRERAQLRIQDMKHLYDQTSNEIDMTIMKLEELKKIKKLMDQGINDHRIYEKFLSDVIDKYNDNFSSIVDILQRYEALMAARNQLQQLQEADMSRLEQARSTFEYLESVVENFPEFTSIPDIINRYLCLLNAKNYLAQLQEDNLKALENARSDVMKLIEEKNFIIMGLNNQIANLQARYENANIKSLECENLVIQIKNNAVKQMNEIDEVKSAIWNVYIHMAQSKKHPLKIKKENVEEQMMYIKRTLTELSKVNQILRKQAKTSSKTKKKN